MITIAYNKTGEWNRHTPCVAFAGSKCIASGDLGRVVLMAKEAMDGDEHAAVLLFDDQTSEPIEVDFRGNAEDILSRIPTGEPPKITPDSDRARGPGRPKLGVVGREVTLLPRHWDWLNLQPGGASVALRKLVEEARRANEGKDRVRQAQNATYKFMSAMAGNLPGFEEATRALFAGNQPRFDECTAMWPADLRDHTRKLSSAAFVRSTEP